jgi:hypothetical protein
VNGVKYYMVAGDVVGVAQSAYDIYNGQFGWSSLVGFLPAAGYGFGKIRNSGIGSSARQISERVSKFLSQHPRLNPANYKPLGLYSGVPFPAYRLPTTSIWRAPKAGKGQTELLKGFDPRDYPGDFWHSVSRQEGAAHFAKDSWIAEGFAKYGPYEDFLIKVTFDESHYKRVLEQFEVIRYYDLGAGRELSIPKEFLEWVNIFGKRTKCTP